MLEEFTKFTDYSPIRFKIRPLYFANFAHHPKSPSYRHPQNSTPKQTNNLNHDSAKEKGGERVAEERYEREQKAKAEEQKKEPHNLSTLLPQFHIKTPQPHKSHISPTIPHYLPLYYTQTPEKAQNSVKTNVFTITTTVAHSSIV